MNDSQKEIYTQIWKEHIQSMRNYCHVKLRGYPEDAEDVLHEAFSRLWNKIVTDDVPPNPKAWLLRTIKNLLMEEYRKNNKDNENLSYLPINEEAELSYYSDITDKMADEYLCTELLKEFDRKLSEDEKLLMQYAIIDKIPQAKIAGLMGLSEPAVKQRIFRLKRKVRRMADEKRKKLGFF